MTDPTTPPQAEPVSEPPAPPPAPAVPPAAPAAPERTARVEPSGPLPMPKPPRPPEGEWACAAMVVCHACCLLVTREGAAVLVDPYFGGPFRWKAHGEKYLDAPALLPEAIPNLAAILVTHDHPDHCEAASVAKLLERTRATVYGPSGVYRVAIEGGIDSRRVQRIDALERVQAGPFEIVGLPNRGSEEEKPCSRMSYLLHVGGARLFHSGDSHGPSPSWRPLADAPDLAFLWPSHADRTLAALKPRRAALVHTDRFEPGDFLCGEDAGALVAALAPRARGCEFLTGPRGTWYAIPSSGRELGKIERPAPEPERERRPSPGARRQSERPSRGGSRRERGERGERSGGRRGGGGGERR